MNWLIGGSEILLGVGLLAAGVATIVVLRPREGLQERLIVRFPGAWIAVGLPLTFLIGTSVALIAVGVGVLR
jgi:hypothetical protein